MGNTKSTVSKQSDDEKQVAAQSKITSARRQRINIQTVQNVLLIWLDSSINDNSADCRNTISQLRQAVNEISTFTSGEECIQFIDNIVDNKACIIISGSLGKHIVPRIQTMSQVDSIFIFCGNEKYHKQWAKEWPKIKGVFTEITPICEALKQVAQQCEQSAISISFVTTGDDVSKKNLDQLDPIFMYTQILKEILLTIKFDDSHIKEFIDYCRETFVHNDKELQYAKELQTKYHQNTPIWWYTCEMFLYPMLNRCLRLTNMDIIIKMGFFITDLHRQIEQLYMEQFSDKNSPNPFVVYRGQGMSKTDFEQMRKIQGGLMSFNNFLSTSKKREVSLRFARRALPDMDTVGILFVMTIDPKKSTTPFASIIEVGYFGDKEDEVLFSMHSIFRIDDIKPMDESERLFQVNLILTDNNDKDLRLLTDHIREETYLEEDGWYRLGLLLLKAGELVKALQVYESMLRQTIDVSKKARIYYELGRIKHSQGQYEEAGKFFKKAIKIGKTLPSTNSHLTDCYINIGAVYDEMGDYSKALSYYEKALKIQKQSLPSNHPNLAISYNNIGSMYSNTGDYLNAISYYERALETSKQPRPPNHYDLTVSYDNVGLVYFNTGDYLKALSYYEKSLEIRKQSLPSNHPDLAASYNNIGSIYSKMDDYPKALSYYEKSLEISQQSFPSNHPDLAASYNNIGSIYENMNNYAKAFSFYEQAVQIGQQSLPPSHPNLQTYQRNLDRVKKEL